MRSGIYSSFELFVRFMIRLFTLPKSPQRLAKTMVRKAARWLKWVVKHEPRVDWSYFGHFNAAWLEASAYGKRDGSLPEVFELFAPLMEKHVMDTYGVKVVAKAYVASGEWDYWTGYSWKLCLWVPTPTEPKRYSILKGWH